MPYLAYVPRIILFLSLSVSFSRSPFASSFVDSTIDRSIYDLSLIYEFSQLSLRRILASYRRFRLRKKEESRLSGYLVIAMTRLFKYLIVLICGAIDDDDDDDDDDDLIETKLGRLNSRPE